MTRTAGPFGWILAAMAVVIALFVARPASPACKVAMIASLPITMEGLRPRVRARINGVDATFLADSGAFYSMITPASAVEFHLKPQPAPLGFYVIGLGGNTSVSIATVKAFTIAGAAVPNLEFLVGGSEVGNDGGGVIGQNFLGGGDAEYDLAGCVIRLMRPRGCGDAAFAYWTKNAAYSMMNIEAVDSPLNRKIVGVVYVNGVRMRAQFDTGAGRSMLWRRAARRAGIDVDGPGVTDAGIGSGVGRDRYRMWVAPVDAFKIGDEEIHHTRLIVADTALDEPGAPDMLLGADFFLSHRLYVANSQHKLYFTYNGGPVFNLTAPQGTAPGAVSPAPPTLIPVGSAKATLIEGPPTDADGFARRGAAFAARRDQGPAIADLTRAVDLAPTEAKYRFQRGRAYMDNSQPYLAMADLDQGLKLAPGDVAGLIYRAQVRFSGHDNGGAIADLDAAGQAAAKEADVRYELGELYVRSDAFPAAVGQFDTWIKAHPDDSKRPLAFNGRCWARALWGQQLDQALTDCDAAVRGATKMAGPLDSRGLVHLRRGEFDKAIADYDAALALQPKIAWSLYGRGLAELREGLAAKGDADIAAATALRPTLPAEARAHGIAPLTSP